MSFLRTVLPIALLASNALAQTFTDCNPLNSTCPDDPALGTTYPEVFNSSSQTELDVGFWNTTAGGSLMSFTDGGLELTLSEKGQSITAQSQFYIMFGTLEVIMEAAPGTGIISSLVLLSDDLDEIDVEIMGGNASFAESNWYGWGDQNQRNALYHPVDNVHNQHNYTIEWSQQQLIWHIDGNAVRTVPYAKPHEYPQSPCFIRFGIWAGGDSNQEGTVAWAGGKTDWSQGPFTMKVQSVKVTDATTNVTSYSYGDNSGSYQSIKSDPGESKFEKLMNKVSKTQAVVNHFNSLSTGAKIGIACGIAGVLLVGIIGFAVFCIKQRRAGKREKALADQSWNEQAAELDAYRQRMARGDFAIQHMGHGEKY
ncbi:glycoside hydrolase family 16 protein [Acrodontium crateriforme]|uniref:Glycoside hydrolase family 16 protein n=1 Tax=Acrodontium crateriforme TaxID=150365 RepID=A0AAQ3LXW8_9PEZI|nr:glycoside hydrolase family 16 protein [Acrodontium crateriforme]